ncbi:hypothetical protein Poli38472_004555 [Pythium oligandrum]|uniref:NADH-ubiquinone oxidoreductase ESSS subunit n=1 Tax=Pythium oligandrum TaxID=41045 RepID=A0A8K1CAP1_PYTOL|nr:hypothetical protein Poli38472_004555 [Pythium oligandrum]|eukprot:TMW59486.1 hypothetical protein Poli38472_004555 [Pythium oligandrum]
MNGAAVARSVRAIGKRGVRNMATEGGPKPYVAMPETAMITSNCHFPQSTHVFERKGWEYSAYLGFLGAPLVLYLGLSNVPETNSEVFAREEAYAKRKGTAQFTIAKRPSSPTASQYIYERTEVGERPTLQA